MHFDKVAIIGVGLIGGSIGLAAKASGIVTSVIGIGRDEPTLARAAAQGAIDRYTTKLAEGVSQADLVIVCTPVGRIVDDVIQTARFAPKRCVITDVGSTKGAIVKQLTNQLESDGPCFVGSHPLAGSEKKGVAYSRKDLLQDRIVLVTPVSRTDQEATALVEHFWQSLGARVVRMDPDEHDLVLATTSHLPHVVASGVANVTPPGWLALTAGGYRDVTRIAAGDPELWADIILANQTAILESLGQFLNRMNQLRTDLVNEDRESVIRWLADAKKVRDALGS